MMLRNSNNEYIEVEDVEVERQAKLFQNISDSAGDFSYQFEIDNNSETRSKLGLDSIVDGFQKSIYTISNIDLCDNSGGVIYKGFIRITSISDVIEASFFSGNNNWFNQMTGNISDLDLSAYELDISTTTIPDSWNNTSGIIFPLVDLGTISKRTHNSWKLDDFQPFIYVKDAVNECFKYSRLKLSGEILSDWRYNHLITTNGSENTKQLEDRKAYIGKSSNQSAGTTFQVVTFPDTTGNFYPGTLWDTANNKYVADSKMIIDVSFTSVVNIDSDFLVFELYKNGSFFKVVSYTFASGSDQTLTYNESVVIESGDYLEMRSKKTQLLATGTIKSAKLTLSPTRLYRVFANNILPNTSQLEFVTNVFKIFNIVSSYDSFTKTVTIDFFKNVIRNEEIDLSDYVDPSTYKTNYTELMESYGDINVLKYSDPSSKSIKKYNTDKDYPYGSGTVQSNNDFVYKRIDILESIFCASDMSLKNPLSVNLPVMDFNEEDESSEITATITNSAGTLFTVDATFKPTLNDIITIKTSTNDIYTGQYRISTVVTATTFHVSGLPYVSDETVTITRSTINRTNNDDQILLLVEPQVTYAEFAPDFGEIDIEDDTTVSDPAIAWFYRSSDGNTIDAFTKSLSFGDIPINNAYQRTMIEDYWQDLEPILQDPVKVYIDAYLPKSIFDSITFKQPIRIKTDKFNSRFIPNRITGYKDSSQPCTLELIKLP